MKLNVANTPVTHEGGKAVETKPYERLRRTVMACMLFEDSFYEDGVSAVERIKQLCNLCTTSQVIELALMASSKYHLRHVPLQMIVEALKHTNKATSIADTIYEICKRPDQMMDLLALYWKDGKRPLAHQLKKGLAKAFTRFDAYQLAKYNRDNPIKLRDVLFLCHAKPKDDEQAEVWKKLVDKTLESPDTWEVRLSAGQDKKDTFEELLYKGKLGKLAILRNLRNMQQSGVPKNAVAYELNRNMKEMLPFQYIAAARECPEWEDIVDPPMVASCALKPRLKGMTIVMVDVSGSMDAPISTKSKMMRLDAACGMAILLRECCDEVYIISFSNEFKVIPARRGMALRDAIVSSQPHEGTELGAALEQINKSQWQYDRIIVITDEQATDNVPQMKRGRNYILNIAGYQNGIGAKNQWTTITGFSEASIDFIRELESSIQENPVTINERKTWVKQ